MTESQNPPTPSQHLNPSTSQHLDPSQQTPSPHLNPSQHTPSQNLNPLSQHLNLSQPDTSLDYNSFQSQPPNSQSEPYHIEPTASRSSYHYDPIVLTDEGNKYISSLDDSVFLNSMHRSETQYRPGVLSDSALNPSSSRNIARRRVHSSNALTSTPSQSSFEQVNDSVYNSTNSLQF